MSGRRPGPSGPASEVELRPLRWEDFEALRAVYYELYEERANGEAIGIHLFQDRPSEVDEVSWFTGLFQRVLSGEVVVVIADLGGRAVGSCTVGPAGPLRRSEMGHVGVLGILVDRRYRGQGIGTSMLERCLAECRDKFEVVRLSVFADNEGARRLYERFGFTVCGRIPRAIKRGGRYIDEELMVLDLGHAPTASRPRNR